MNARQEAIEQFLRATKLMQSSEYEDALNVFQGVREELKEVPALFYNTSQILLELGNLDKALQDINRALKLDPNNVKYLRHQFKILQKQSNYDKALKIADKINKLEYFPDIKINQAFLYLRTGSNDKSIQIFNELLRDGTHNPTVYFTLGILKYQSDQFKEAEKLIREAIKQNYQLEDARQVLIAILERDGRIEEAIDFIEKIEDRTEELNYSLAKLYKQNDNMGKSLRIAEHLLKSNPKIEYRTFRGHLLREMGNYNQAIDIYSKVLDEDQNNLSAIKGKALSLVELGEYDEANQLFERGERLNRGGEMPNFENMIQDLDVLE